MIDYFRTINQLPNIEHKNKNEILLYILLEYILQSFRSSRK